MRRKYISKHQVHPTVGYCHYGKHRGYITKEALKEHNCLGKGCRFFQKDNSAPYWTSYYNDIKKKKLRKFYAKSRGFWLMQGYSIDDFCNACKNYYGTWTKIPFNNETNKLDISLFLEHVGYQYS